MAEVNKKVAAALAAVNTYLQEEEAVFQQEKQRNESLNTASQPSLWGHSGRQDMMSMRQLIQMKAFSRF